MVSFEAQKFLILIKSSLFFSSVAHAFSVISKNPLPNRRSVLFLQDQIESAPEIKYLKGVTMLAPCDICFSM